MSAELNQLCEEICELFNHPESDSRHSETGELLDKKRTELLRIIWPSFSKKNS